jgi:DNA-binding LacI/PurR family transcriptional regulator
MHPALTALRGDIAAAGSAAARILRELAAGGQPESVAEAAPELHVRMSSGPSGVPVLPATGRTRLPA